MIELNQLQQLICIAKNKTISKASEELHISQPALSRSMQRLEMELDVQIFDRYVNKVILNQNGELVVKHAKHILDNIDEMIFEVRDFDESLHSLAIATCAPGPLWNIEPLLKEIYPKLCIHSRVIDESKLIFSLKNQEFQLVLTPFEAIDEELVSYPYIEEDIYLSVPLDHPFNNKKEISFQELDGETMILYSHIGFWYDLHIKTMPNTKFLKQDERVTFNEIVKASSLPSFTSNLSMKKEGKMKNRIIIPFKDQEAHVTFYLTLLRKDQNKYKDIIQKIKFHNEF